ncbi:hypothetical protein OU426_01330 [Frigidibacter sp. RF13]|uniref:hypothetical protein n=1 Tax=Frigidibacter sp. RF13 TaxID=2997340 RepID=UPI002270BC67|nr:hypothetical protein [Frigidibacter sp. RF13]MCY1125483.1 hypothetical protein [Frigidibacter sp. RF13]
MSYHLTSQTDRPHAINMSFPLWLGRLFSRKQDTETADQDLILRHELERMQSLSAHLLADIGIECAADASSDELVRQANRLKHL